jgi:hypothetical protein
MITDDAREEFCLSCNDVWLFLVTATNLFPIKGEIRLLIPFSRFMF